MKIEIHNGLQNPRTVEVTRVVVLDKFDNPVAIAVEVDDGIILAETAANEGPFNAMLRNLGIDRTVVVHTAQERPLPTIHIPGG